ncbi:MAG: radical SAM family heme chaperone HemW [Gammaproteobacteria bacterium]
MYLNFTQTIPLSLYVHLPWCVRKCPYCDFNSHESGHTLLQETAYVDALIRDLESALSRIWGRRITSIFIGGGTPSLFSVAAIQRLLAGLRALLNLHPETEITLEVNPGTAEAEKFRGFREAGVNRLSIGVQSFDNEKLQRLGRIHDGREARAAITMARDAGFEELNIDLMFGLPGQTTGEAVHDLQLAMDQKPVHISWYQLTIEPNTVFHAKPPVLPDDDLVWQMQEEGQRLLADNGYAQYEISAYASDGHQCAHNLNYWRFGDCLGIGAGAHSKLTDVTAGKVIRTARHRLPDRYLELAGRDDVITESRELDDDDLKLEFMMNAMRLKAGVHPSLFLQHTGMPINVIESELGMAAAKGMLDYTIHSLKPTALGQQYLNDLLQIFMTESETDH